MKKLKDPGEQVFRMTPQRAEILRLLDGNRSHPSAEEIYRRVSRKFPGISFATVYNTLQFLLDAGRVRGIRIDPERSRFDPGLEPHAHLMCVRCGLITDLPFRSSAAPRGVPRGFKILHSNVEFYGICPACAGKGKKK